jgi:murein endopeptidase
VLRAALLLLLIALAALLAGRAGPVSAQEEPWQLVPDRPSLALGLPWNGRLARGVQLVREGPDHLTWDPIRKRAPNRPWRRWGTARLVRTTLRMLADYRRANPEAPRVLVGDLSRPLGGDFGPRYGGLGHASHQNGLDVDVFYPRRDRRERAPRRPRQVDRRLAQELVDRFVRAGAVYVFVGTGLGLRGPKRVVQELWNHHDHLHVRLPNDRPRMVMLGRSHGGRPIRAYRIGNPAARRLLVVGSVHGNEPAGVAVARRLLRRPPPLHAELWVVPTLNPDGLARRTRANARGADLNRDFGRFSQRETRIARRLILRARPSLSIWFHQPQGLVRAYGPSVVVARRYAAAARERYRTIVWPPGTASRWQNGRGQRSFVVELGPGRLRARAAARHVSAVLAFTD